MWCWLSRMSYRGRGSGGSGMWEGVMLYRMVGYWGKVDEGPCGVGSEV